ncbi:MAG TPA: bifunctional phosphopantothenoylcysteine decarboxylase/phosphopantothenate--cysteine ligase CoaBC [Candidatus Hydrogenedentes bacterium]|nr:bifunctional phosphopantothenoylcysteine decarboxylase/phosphopantothenate--cysteine ligase CoaBC [Candidatus Hydrogenedentota bacterium]
MKRTFSTREIVLGVTGSIAAYKACEIASRLVEFGACVTPVLTRSARELVGPATFEAITGRRAVTAMFERLQDPEIEHIAVAQRANLFLIAPATANILAKAAHGIADDWLSTSLLATRAPVLFAPAMNANMYAHPATQANIETLRRRGCWFVGPDVGRLACGTEGVGRMAEPLAIIEAAAPLVSTRRDLAGKRVLITSGGCREPIDPVRFLGNRSSGKMGRALALEALVRGAGVTVVSGPAAVALPHGVEVVPVETASEMAEATVPRAAEADVVVAAAAVADYRVDKPAAEKRKRSGQPLTLNLTENPDVLAAISANRHQGQVIAGFAAETADLLENARVKLDKKKLDLVVANKVGAPDSGFDSHNVAACIIDNMGNVEDLGIVSKEIVAEQLFDRIAARLA